MYMATYRVYRDLFAMHKGMCVQIVSDDPELTVDFVKAIEGVDILSHHITYTRWLGTEKATVTFVVTKGLRFIPRIIPPFLAGGKRWQYWRTIDKSSCK